MTDLHERLTKLRKRFTDGYTTDDEVLRELNAVSTALPDGNYQEKIRDAIGLYKIYVSPRQWEQYSGRREGVKGFFLQDLGSAIDIARQSKAPE